MPILITSNVIAAGQQLTFNYAGDEDGTGDNVGDRNGSGNDAGGNNNGRDGDGGGGGNISGESKNKRRRTCLCGSVNCTGVLPYSDNA